MKTKAPDFQKKWFGIVDVWSNDKRARLTSTSKSADGKVKVFPNGSSTLDVNLADLPRNVRRLIVPGIKSEKPRRLRIRLNSDGDCVETVTPTNGVFTAKLVGLGPKQQDGSYKLIHKVYNEGKENENAHDEFIAIYELTDTKSPYFGNELPGYYLHYKFCEIPEGQENEGFTMFNCADTPQATQFHRLVRWGEIHGDILDEDIRWPDDGIILETLEQRALDADREVNLIFQDGYIKDIQPIEDYDELTDDDIDNAFPETDDEDDEQEDEVVEVKPNKAKVKTAEVPVKKDVLQDTMKGKSKSAPAAKGKNGKRPVEEDDL